MRNTLRPWMNLLLAPEGEGGGGGGGTGTTETPPALNDAAKKEISTMINGAMKGWGERFEKNFDAKLQPLSGLGESLKAIQDKLSTNATPPGDKPPGNTVGDPEAQKVLLKLQSQVETLTQKLTATEAEKAEITARTQRAEERSVLEKALDAAGLKGGALAGAAALLIHERKAISRRDDGSVVWKVRREAAGQSYDDYVDVKDGLSEFLKTDEGKGFLPPRDVKGSGNVSAFVPITVPKGQEGRMADAAATLSAFLANGG